MADKGRLREGDIEALRRKMAQDGRPMKSTMVVDHDGSHIHYTADGGKVRVVDVVTGK